MAKAQPIDINKADIEKPEVKRPAHWRSQHGSGLKAAKPCSVKP